MFTCWVSRVDNNNNPWNTFILCFIVSPFHFVHVQSPFIVLVKVVWHLNQLLSISYTKTTWIYNNSTTWILDLYNYLRFLQYWHNTGNSWGKFTGIWTIRYKKSVCFFFQSKCLKITLPIWKPSRLRTTLPIPQSVHRVLHSNPVSINGHSTLDRHLLGLVVY